mmetsp:Transcript_49843/g.128583  ORF Transcript_49843/g.128583 Transcript_49843/m.128583 type:complete len:130 (+) Transcript_49843:267-656(+)
MVKQPEWTIEVPQATAVMEEPEVQAGGVKGPCALNMEHIVWTPASMGRGRRAELSVFGGGHDGEELTEEEVAEIEEIEEAVIDFMDLVRRRGDRAAQSSLAPAGAMTPWQAGTPERARRRASGAFAPGL